MMQEEKGSQQLYPNLPPSENNDLSKIESGHARTRNGADHRKSVGDSGDDRGGGSSGDDEVFEEDETKDYKYFWKRVLKDLTNKNLIPVKILFFFKYATLFVLYPFLTLHMDALGLDEWEIGVNQACVPIVAILGPPVSGVIADKIGNFKIVLSVITLINAAVALLLLLVPVARETVKLPSTMTFGIACDPSSHQFILHSIDDHMCSFNSTSFTKLPRDNIVQCGRICPQSQSQLATNSNETNLELDFMHQNVTIATPHDFPKFPLESNGTFLVRFDNTSYEFQTEEGLQPRFLCDGGQCQINVKYDTNTDIDGAKGDIYKQIAFTKLELIYSENLTMAEIKMRHGLNLTHPRFTIDGPITFGSELHDNPVCSQQSSSQDGQGIDGDGDGSGCETKCFLQIKRNTFCANESERQVYNVWVTFAMYTVFRLLLGFASATSFIMFEGAVLAILKQYGGDYGLQRVSATFAAIIVAPFSGFLLQTYSFKPVFYLYATLQAFSAFLTLKIDLKFKKPSENVLAHLRDVLSQLEILIFFLAMLCSGTLWGYLETFLFLFLKQLGGSRTLMGLTISVGGIFGLPFLIFSRPLIKRTGHVNILCMGFLFYGIRYFGYSLIENPLLCLPFEALESITSSLAITAAATYAVALSTLQTIATVQGIMGALYFGIGRGAGSFIGGILIKKFGHRQTFQMFGLSAIVACLLYMLVNILYVRRNTKVGSGLDINNLNGGLVISNNGAGAGKGKSKDAKTKEAIQMKQPQNHDSELGYGKINPGFEEGDGDDGNKFTDIPLDEENSFSHGPNNNNKSTRSK